MFAQMKSRWRKLKSSEPGKRFQTFHKDRQAARKKGSIAGRIAIYALGIGLILIGAFLLVVPGPGSLVIALGLAILASESQKLASLLDSSEVKIRGWMKKAKQQWRKKFHAPKPRNAST